MDTTYFLNDKYFILDVLLKYSTVINDTRYAIITQDEICKETGFCKQKVNRTMKEFYDNDYIKMAGHRQYIIPQETEEIYKYLKKKTKST